VAFLSPRADGSVDVELALGGHPPALVLRGDGQVDVVGRFGSLLGAYPDPSLEDSRFTLAPGDTLLLYTDGVTEAGSCLHRIGQEGLVDLLAGAHGNDPHAIVDVVEQAVLDAGQGEPSDDVALLALRAGHG
jgi:serine phosphatase RsbU (regulator of sigma subunit)